MAAHENAYDDNVRFFNGQKRSRDDQDASEKLPPFSEEAEMGVLGCILESEGRLLRLARELHTLRPSDFYREKHRIIYQTMLDMADRGDPIAIDTVDVALKMLGKIEQVDGTAYLFNLPNCVRGDIDTAAPYFAHIVKTTSAKRRMIQAGADITAAAYDEKLDDADIRDVLEREYTAAKTLYDETVGTSDLFPILTDEELEDVAPSVGVLGDILYEDSVAILYGQSGRWKSFLALAWALCIAAGVRWLGRAVKRGHVVYIAAEGGRGIKARVAAWKHFHGLASVPLFHPLLVSVNLLNSAEINRLVQSINRLVPESPTLIVFDTLSRSMPGADENAGKDGSKAFAAASDLRQHFPGATVLLVAHPGKDDSRGIRGWSGYFQWADTVVSVKASDNKPRLDPGEDTVTLTSEKPKECEPFADITFTAQREAWTNERGESVNSLVLVSAEKKPHAPSNTAGAGNRRKVWDAVNDSGRPISFGELEKLLVPGEMSKPAMVGHLKALQNDGQITKTPFGAYAAN